MVLMGMGDNTCDTTVLASPTHNNTALSKANSPKR